MAAYMWNGLQPVTSFTLIPNPKALLQKMKGPVRQELEDGLRQELRSEIEKEMGRDANTKAEIAAA